MKKFIIISLFLFSSICFSQLPKIEKTKFTIGETLRFQSEILDEERVLNIYLPYGYSPDSAKTYPVIYLLDGSIDEDFIHIAGLVQFLSFPWINDMPECIVVGIANVDRKRDFTWPTSVEQDKQDFPTTGGAAKFIGFMEEELIPIVHENYNCSGDNSIIGQSLGGLLVANILYSNRDLFKRYLIVSPSIWWDNESILKMGDLNDVYGQTVFIAVGNEGKQMVSGAKKLYSIFKKSQRNTSVFFKYYPEHDHGDILHHAATDGFKKIFSSKN